MADNQYGPTRIRRAARCDYAAICNGSRRDHRMTVVAMSWCHQQIGYFRTFSGWA
jgi:hypothetical protein